VACPKCGSEKVKYSDRLPAIFMEFGDFAEVAYGTVTCANCGKKLGNATSDEIDLAKAQLHFRHGQATGQWFRSIRLALKFRAQDLAKLLQVRAETISHWETRGQGAVDATAWIALGALLEDCIACRTTIRDRLLAAMNPTTPTKAVKVSAPIRQPERVFPGTTRFPKSPPRPNPPASQPTPPGGLPGRTVDLKETQKGRSPKGRFAKSASAPRRRST
jgi:hypothetical protein